MCNWRQRCRLLHRHPAQIAHNLARIPDHMNRPRSLPGPMLRIREWESRRLAIRYGYLFALRDQYALARSNVRSSDVSRVINRSSWLVILKVGTNTGCTNLKLKLDAANGSVPPQ